MSDLQKIRERIYKEEKIDQVLEALGCWGIGTEQGGKLFVAGLPDGDNQRSVQIKNTPSLTSNIRSKGITGTIFDVVSYILYEADTEEARKSSLSKSKFWLCNKLQYLEYIDDFYKLTAEKEKPQPNKWLHKLQQKRKKEELQSAENEILSENILEQYGATPYLGWYNEGLSIKTQKLFGVGIDVRSDRITFPVHNRHGQLIGIKGRYCGDNPIIEDKYKYIYIHPCNKSIEFYNLHRALPHIKELKEAIVVEGGKTTWYLTQWGFRNCISIEGDSMSEEQLILLKTLGLDVKFIFAYDKDKNAEFVSKEAARLKGRLKYGVFDTKGLLKEKDSPTDKGKEIWESLYQNKFKIR
ncbi:DNA primase [Bacillus atrophaeus]|uniref:DNA primase n=1 Tax=Bacillus atrophaeus TaxID=1452 RepID=UPI0022814640|nr:DNA primase [Bacillus atrophaeus]MCY8810604.1 DNA primase [Bacillus atrophaeus]MCY8907756.1 DNA primase [Bacillus atrophaeus]MEC0837761.1 DNA primase [Bacillus atrophaeus]MEC0847662.1 DNA primase [Bacillus atrophaeus]MEC0849882.1 DNA primase [Bacillus atrophaeus]